MRGRLLVVVVALLGATLASPPAVADDYRIPACKLDAKDPLTCFLGIPQAVYDQLPEGWNLPPCCPDPPSSPAPAEPPAEPWGEAEAGVLLASGAAQRGAAATSKASESGASPPGDATSARLPRTDLVVDGLHPRAPASSDVPLPSLPEPLSGGGEEAPAAAEATPGPLTPSLPAPGLPTPLRVHPRPVVFTPYPSLPSGGIETAALPGAPGRGASAAAPLEDVSVASTGLPRFFSPVGHWSGEWSFRETMVLLGGILALVLPYLLLYRRIDRQHLFENGRREEILEYVKARPGATAADLADAFRIDYKTARHHLDLLQGFGVLSRRSAGGNHRYFENHGRYSPAEERGLVLTAREENVAFLRLVARHPGLTQAQARRRLTLARSTVSKRVRILLESGLLRADGRTLWLTPDGAMALAVAGSQSRARSPERRRATA